MEIADHTIAFYGFVAHRASSFHAGLGTRSQYTRQTYQHLALASTSIKARPVFADVYRQKRPGPLQWLMPPRRGERSPPVWRSVLCSPLLSPFGTGSVKHQTPPAQPVA
jgi:hypothetical protein